MRQVPWPEVDVGGYEMEYSMCSATDRLRKKTAENSLAFTIHQS